ncbi:hypothetical protein Agub_g3735 [Astrephomene gubernaculifera]|uniref:procollagen-proline 4-dioxygenase n=1 Tax=Astrephomene gubernaculifera TaxID=47775 RepID=A0AAD3DKE8_9CHLO|nr:hypothetical protein Agub_g3735 [Astrephomene gubernaculifera]
MRATLPLIFLLHVVLALSGSDFEERLIGWQGETYTHSHGPPDEWALTLDEPEGVPWVETVSWSPRVFVYHNFLSSAECRHIKRVAAPMMKQSSVVGQNGSSVLDTYRTSYGTFVKRRHDPVIERVLRRVAAWTKTPVENQEDLQVLRYGVGQKYGAHTDSLIDDSPRMATVLLYLHDTEEGGETAFTSPAASWLDPQLEERLGPFSECARGHVAFRPKKGDALMFWSIKPDGTHDPLSMHTGCPVVRGVKWTATSWVHTMPYNYEDYLKQGNPGKGGRGSGGDEEREGEPGACEDFHSQCSTWASSGECSKNPTYMNANCGRACRRCEPCDADQLSGTERLACINRNRKKLGFLVYDTTELEW